MLVGVNGNADETATILLSAFAARRPPILRFGALAGFWKTLFHQFGTLDQRTTFDTHLQTLLPVLFDMESLSQERQLDKPRSLVSICLHYGF